MCDLTGEKSKIFIGYKVMAVKNGHFYSTFTGQRIKVGKVPKAPIKLAKRISDYWNPMLSRYAIRACGFYDTRFNGKTGAFINKDDAQDLYNNIKNSTLMDGFSIVLVKITFSSEVYAGTYNDYPVIASDIIESIELELDKDSQS